MHTLIILAVGLALLGLCFLFGKGKAAIAFIPVWLAATAYNMWFGVMRAGYSVGDELPVFLVLFLLPAGLAVSLRNKR